jgi:hypothetical protein
MRAVADPGGRGAMNKALRWTVLVSAMAAGVMLVTCAPAGLAAAASTGSSAPAGARTAATGTAPLGNYQITGNERAIGCLTAHRCVAVGYGGGKAPGQVVTVVGGKQVRVTAVRSASNLVAVSCPNRFGCWAVGSPRIGDRRFVLVKIGSTGSVTSVSTVRLPEGMYLGSISCTSRTSCEIFGTTTDKNGDNEWYLASWNGRKLSQRYVVGPLYYGADTVGSISCWQANCVAVGSTYCDGSTCNSQGTIVTTNHGKPGPLDTLSGEGSLSGVSCVSSSTCYATLVSTEPSVVFSLVTLHDGVPVNTLDEPDAAPAIECAGATCWAVGGSPAVFVMFASGVPTVTSAPDPAVYWPSIAKRGNGFAAVGEEVNGGARVSELVTN